ncbi:hypothetical protein GCM10022291_14410 [Postechiella marina]|uniref:Thioredoxin domain-containing protein n=1 Tax=Postechiella marina TaxID=943941 RepID=A0ABP8C6T2_9FLAO
MKSIKNTILFFSVYLLIFSYSNAQEKDNTFKITGEVTGLTGDLHFRHPNRKYTKENTTDIIKVVNGKINYTDTISKLSMLRAYPSFDGSDSKVFKIPKDGKGYFPVKCAYLSFYAFPGANITINGEASDFMDMYPGGDKLNESLASANKLTFPYYNKMGNLAVKNTYETDSLIIKENNKKAEALFSTLKNELVKHIKNNPKSLAAAWYLNDMLIRSQIEISEAEELFNGLSSEELSEYPDYQDVATRIAGTKATKEGFPVPSIKTNATLDGKAFDIKSLQGKYVLIDFWGLWCSPCVAEMPEVKVFQEKHKDNLVVVGINSGDTKEKIQAFVEKHGYMWQQLLSDKANTSDNFVNHFNVQGFPTKLIIDRRGNIVKRFVGGGEEAFKLLEELLEK